MATDYTPVYLPGEVISLTASGTISPGDPVEVSGNATVAKVAGSNSPKCVGIAGNAALVNGRVTVFARSTVHEGKADGTVTAGDVVAASPTANRQVITLAPMATNADVGAAFSQSAVNTAINAVGTGVNNDRAALGIALTTATDGNIVRWMQT